jgi:hypothetical protein
MNTTVPPFAPSFNKGGTRVRALFTLRDTDVPIYMQYPITSLIILCLTVLLLVLTVISAVMLVRRRRKGRHSVVT